ncbi:hypothetical protein HAX54_039013, partial [Datura stramonium]|nr:hypothetical protein [Datura stramonium]
MSVSACLCLYQTLRVEPGSPSCSVIRSTFIGPGSLCHLYKSFVNHSSKSSKQ